MYNPLNFSQSLGDLGSHRANITLSSGIIIYNTKDFKSCGGLIELWNITIVT
jgi:hypothetical protein